MTWILLAYLNSICSPEDTGSLHLKSSKDSTKITGMAPLGVGRIREVSEHKVDLPLFCKVSIRSLTVAKISIYFSVKLNIF